MGFAPCSKYSMFAPGKQACAGREGRFRMFTQGENRAIIALHSFLEGGRPAPCCTNAYRCPPPMVFPCPWMYTARRFTRRLIDQIPQGGERNDAFTKSHIQNQTAIWMPQHKVLCIRLIVMRSVLHLIRLQSAGCHLRSTPRSRVFLTDFFVLPAEDAVFLPGL